LSTTVRKKKNTDTRATAVTKLLALKNDYLNNPKRKKTQDKDSQKEQTNKQKLKNSESPHQQKQTKIFPPLSLQILYSQTLPKLKINYSRCFLSNPL